MEWNRESHDTPDQIERDKQGRMQTSLKLVHVGFQAKQCLVTANVLVLLSQRTLSSILNIAGDVAVQSCFAGLTSQKMAADSRMADMLST